MDKKKFPPAKSLEAREEELISLAIDAVEERIRNGTASAQELVHFLKLGSIQARLDKEETQERIKLTKAKTKAIEDEKRDEAFYAQVIDAIRSYQGSANV